MLFRSLRCLGTPRLRPAPFANMGGLLVPDFQCIVTVGHGFACPTSIVFDDPASPERVVKVEYRRLPLSDGLSREYPFVYIAKEFFWGGRDLALCLKAPPSDGIQAFARRLSAHLAPALPQDARTLFAEPRVVLVRDVRSAAVGGHGVWQNGMIVVNDIGYPGLSGSPAYLATHDGRLGELVGIYTARRCGDSLDAARVAKLDGVVTYGRQKCGLQDVSKSIQSVPIVPIPPKSWQAATFDKALPEATGTSRAKANQGSSPEDGTQKMLREIRALVGDLGHEVKTLNKRMDDVNKRIDILGHDVNKRIDVLGHDVNKRFDILGHDVNERFDILDSIVQNTIRRQAYVMPLHGVINATRFRSWPLNGRRVVKDPNGLRVHAFDADSDIDYGNWM